MSGTAGGTAQIARGMTKQKKRLIGIGVIVLVLIGMVLGTKVVPSTDAAAQGAEKFDPATFGADNFPMVKEAVEAKAVDGVTLADALAADPDAAAAEYAIQSSGGPVYSVTLTGEVTEGASGIYTIVVPELPAELTVRVQVGPAVNGTELRDASGEIEFGQFKNQIDFQNAGAALNDAMKAAILADVDPAALPGKTITVTGAFTLINPKSWLITPVALEQE